MSTSHSSVPASETQINMSNDPHIQNHFSPLLPHNNRLSLNSLLNDSPDTDINDYNDMNTTTTLKHSNVVSNKSNTSGINSPLLTPQGSLPHHTPLKSSHPPHGSNLILKGLPEQGQGGEPTHQSHQSHQEEYSSTTLPDFPNNKSNSNPTTTLNPMNQLTNYLYGLIPSFSLAFDDDDDDIDPYQYQQELQQRQQFNEKWYEFDSTPNVKKPTTNTKSSRNYTSLNNNNLNNNHHNNNNNHSVLPTTPTLTQQVQYANERHSQLLIQQQSSSLPSQLHSGNCNNIDDINTYHNNHHTSSHSNTNPFTSPHFANNINDEIAATTPRTTTAAATTTPLNQRSKKPHLTKLRLSMSTLPTQQTHPKSTTAVPLSTLLRTYSPMKKGHSPINNGGFKSTPKKKEFQTKLRFSLSPSPALRHGIHHNDTHHHSITRKGNHSIRHSTNGYLNNKSKGNSAVVQSQQQQQQHQIELDPISQFFEPSTPQLKDQDTQHSYDEFNPIPTFALLPDNNSNKNNNNIIPVAVTPTNNSKIKKTISTSSLTGSINDMTSPIFDSMLSTSQQQQQQQQQQHHQHQQSSNTNNYNNTNINDTQQHKYQTPTSPTRPTSSSGSFSSYYDDNNNINTTLNNNTPNNHDDTAKSFTKTTIAHILETITTPTYHPVPFASRIHSKTSSLLRSHLFSFSPTGGTVNNNDNDDSDNTNDTNNKEMKSSSPKLTDGQSQRDDKNDPFEPLAKTATLFRGLQAFIEQSTALVEAGLHTNGASSLEKRISNTKQATSLISLALTTTSTTTSLAEGLNNELTTNIKLFLELIVITLQQFQMTQQHQLTVLQRLPAGARNVATNQFLKNSIYLNNSIILNYLLVFAKVIHQVNKPVGIILQSIVTMCKLWLLLERSVLQNRAIVTKLQSTHRLIQKTNKHRSIQVLLAQMSTNVRKNTTFSLFLRTIITLLGVMYGLQWVTLHEKIGMKYFSESIQLSILSLTTPITSLCDEVGSEIKGIFRSRQLDVNVINDKTVTHQQLPLILRFVTSTLKWFGGASVCDCCTPTFNGKVVSCENNHNLEDNNKNINNNNNNNNPSSTSTNNNATSTTQNELALSKTIQLASSYCKNSSIGNTIPPIANNEENNAGVGDVLIDHLDEIDTNDAVIVPLVGPSDDLDEVDLDIKFSNNEDKINSYNNNDNNESTILNISTHNAQRSELWDIDTTLPMLFNSNSIGGDNIIIDGVIENKDEDLNNGKNTEQFSIKPIKTLPSLIPPSSPSSSSSPPSPPLTSSGLSILPSKLLTTTSALSQPKQRFTNTTRVNNGTPHVTSSNRTNKLTKNQTTVATPKMFANLLTPKLSSNSSNKRNSTRLQANTPRALSLAPLIPLAPLFIPPPRHITHTTSHLSNNNHNNISNKDVKGGSSNNNNNNSDTNSPISTIHPALLQSNTNTRCNCGLSHCIHNLRCTCGSKHCGFHSKIILPRHKFPFLCRNCIYAVISRIRNIIAVIGGIYSIYTVYNYLSPYLTPIVTAWLARHGKQAKTMGTNIQTILANLFTKIKSNLSKINPLPNLSYMVKRVGKQFSGTKSTLGSKFQNVCTTMGSSVYSCSQTTQSDVTGSNENVINLDQAQNTTMGNTFQNQISKNNTIFASKNRFIQTIIQYIPMAALFSLIPRILHQVIGALPHSVTKFINKMIFSLLPKSTTALSTPSYIQPTPIISPGWKCTCSKRMLICTCYTNATILTSYNPKLFHSKSLQHLEQFPIQLPISPISPISLESRLPTISDINNSKIHQNDLNTINTIANSDRSTTLALSMQTIQSCPNTHLIHPGTNSKQIISRHGKFNHNNLHVHPATAAMMIKPQHTVAAAVGAGMCQYLPITPPNHLMKNYVHTQPALFNPMLSSMTQGTLNTVIGDQFIVDNNKSNSARHEFSHANINQKFNSIFSFFINNDHTNQNHTTGFDSFQDSIDHFNQTQLFAPVLNPSYNNPPCFQSFSSNIRPSLPFVILGHIIHYVGKSITLAENVIMKLIKMINNNMHSIVYTTIIAAIIDKYLSPLLLSFSSLHVISTPPATTSHSVSHNDAESQSPLVKFGLHYPHPIATFIKNSFNFVQYQIVDTFTTISYSLSLMYLSAYQSIADSSHWVLEQCNNTIQSAQQIITETHLVINYYTSLEFIIPFISLHYELLVTSEWFTRCFTTPYIHIKYICNEFGKFCAEIPFLVLFALSIPFELTWSVVSTIVSFTHSTIFESKLISPVMKYLASTSFHQHQILPRYQYLTTKLPQSIIDHINDRADSIILTLVDWFQDKFEFDPIRFNEIEQRMPLLSALYQRICTKPLQIPSRILNHFFSPYFNRFKQTLIDIKDTVGTISEAIIDKFAELYHIYQPLFGETINRIIETWDEMSIEMTHGWNASKTGQFFNGHFATIIDIIVTINLLLTPADYCSPWNNNQHIEFNQMYQEVKEKSSIYEFLLSCSQPFSTEIVPNHCRTCKECVEFVRIINQSNEPTIHMSDSSHIETNTHDLFQNNQEDSALLIAPDESLLLSNNLDIWCSDDEDNDHESILQKPLVKLNLGNNTSHTRLSPSIINNTNNFNAQPNTPNDHRTNVINASELALHHLFSPIKSSSSSHHNNLSPIIPHTNSNNVSDQAPGTEETDQFFDITLTVDANNNSSSSPQPQPSSTAYNISTTTQSTPISSPTPTLQQQQLITTKSTPQHPILTTTTITTPMTRTPPAVISTPVLFNTTPTAISNHTKQKPLPSSQLQQHHHDVTIGFITPQLQLGNNSTLLNNANHLSYPPYANTFGTAIITGKNTNNSYNPNNNNYYHPFNSQRSSLNHSSASIGDSINISVNSDVLFGDSRLDAVFGVTSHNIDISSDILTNLNDSVQLVNTILHDSSPSSSFELQESTQKHELNQPQYCQDGSYNQLSDNNQPETNHDEKISYSPDKVNRSNTTIVQSNHSTNELHNNGTNSSINPPSISNNTHRITIETNDDDIIDCNEDQTTTADDSDNNDNNDNPVDLNQTQLNNILSLTTSHLPTLLVGDDDTDSADENIKHNIDGDITNIHCFINENNNINNNSDQNDDDDDEIPLSLHEIPTTPRNHNESIDITHSRLELELESLLSQSNGQFPDINSELKLNQSFLNKDYDYNADSDADQSCFSHQPVRKADMNQTISPLITNFTSNDTKENNTKKCFESGEKINNCPSLDYDDANQKPFTLRPSVRSSIKENRKRRQTMFANDGESNEFNEQQSDQFTDKNNTISLLDKPTVGDNQLDEKMPTKLSLQTTITTPTYSLKQTTLPSQHFSWMRPTTRTTISNQTIQADQYERGSGFEKSSRLDIPNSDNNNSNSNRVLYADPIATSPKSLLRTQHGSTKSPISSSTTTRSQTTTKNTTTTRPPLISPSKSQSNSTMTRSQSQLPSSTRPALLQRTQTNTLNISTRAVSPSRGGLGKDKSDSSSPRNLHAKSSFRNDDAGFRTQSLGNQPETPRRTTQARA